jgi:hypothetical protein
MTGVNKKRALNCYLSDLLRLALLLPEVVPAPVVFRI